MSLRTILSNYGFAFQRELFPALEEELGPLGERYELFVTVLGFVQVEQFLTCLRGLPGRPQEDRAALARAFIAKAVFAITTTRALVERLAIDPPLRRLERQLRMTLPEMLDDLPRAPDVGVKRGAKGYQASWSGYKLHIDAADGGIPLSCILTSASLHDSQAAIPLATMTVARVTNLYDPGSSPGQALMDSAYDAPEIRAHSASMGHVAIIDVNPRSTARKRQLTAEAKAQRSLGHVSCERLRYRERSTVERVNGRLKDDFGGRQVRVRGHAKVLCHLMFGILALTVAQLVRLLA